jgi:hypothetical protein
MAAYTGLARSELLKELRIPGYCANEGSLEDLIHAVSDDVRTDLVAAGYGSLLAQPPRTTGLQEQGPVEGDPAPPPSTAEVNSLRQCLSDLVCRPELKMFIPPLTIWQTGRVDFLETFFMMPSHNLWPEGNPFSTADVGSLDQRLSEPVCQSVLTDIQPANSMVDR